MAYLGNLSDWLDRILGSFRDASVSGRTITLTKHDNTTVELQTQDTVYDVASTTSDGLMSSTDKQALDIMKTSLDGGSTGQVLVKTAQGYQWNDLVNVPVNPSGDNT